MKLTRRALFALLPGGLVGRWLKPKPKFTTGTAIKHHFDDERYPIMYANDNQFWILRRIGFEPYTVEYIPLNKVYK